MSLIMVHLKVILCCSILVFVCECGIMQQSENEQNTLDSHKLKVQTSHYINQLSTAVAQIMVHTDSNYFKTFRLGFEFLTNYM